MTRVIVVRPGTRLWDELRGVRPGPGEWVPMIPADSLSRALRIDTGEAVLAAAADTFLDERARDLGEVLDRVPTGGAILLFDESEALLGRRTGVADAHDRYANAEVSYLLSERGERLQEGARSRARWRRRAVAPAESVRGRRGPHRPSRRAAPRPGRLRHGRRRR